MAAVNITAPTLVSSGRGIYAFSDQVNVNSAQGVFITWTMPDDIPAEGLRLKNVELHSISSATVHDIHADGEYALLAHRDPSGKQISGFAVSSRVHYYYDTSSANIGGIAMEWTDVHHRIFANDRITLTVPPADDNGAPTGDYEINIEFTI